MRHWLAVLTNSTAQLSAARGRVQVLEAEAAWKANAEAPGPQTEEARRRSVRYAPTVTASSSRDGYVPGRSVLFTNLYGKDDLVLAANVECTGVYGRRVAFKETASTKRMAFDVNDTVKANAAMRSADAAILHALNPPLVPVAPVVPVPPRW